METRRSLSIILFLTLGTLIVPSFSYAYSTVTHDNLTKSTFREYERLTADMFSDSDVQAATKGSIDEDISTRPINHFYDPITGVGLQRNIWRDKNPVTGIASPVWARSILKQGRPGRREELFSSDSDFSWDRAVYEYVHGDKTRAMEVLGHVLHLVQDVTVPAHVRNDAHPTFIRQQYDPYETFTEGLGRDIAVVVRESTQANSIEDIMKEVATFTNNNFLSSDTEFEYYEHPAKSDLYFDANFGIHKQNGHIVVRAREEYDEDIESFKTEYFFDDKDGEISNAYWSVLSKKAVVYGVAVIDLFLREVEKEKQSGELLAMNKSYNEVNSFVNSLATVRDAKVKFSSLAAADVYELNKEDFDGYFAAADVYGIHVPAVARDSALKEERNTNQPTNALLAFEDATKSKSIIGESIPAGMPLLVEIKEDSVDTPIEVVETVVIEEDRVAEEVEPKESIEEKEAKDVPANNLSPFEPGGYGYGGGGSAVVEENEPVVPSAPVVTYPVEGTPLATSTVTFSGTGAAGNVVTGVIATTTATTTVLGDDTWSLGDFVLQEGTTNTTFTQTDSDGGVSSETTLQVTVDTTVPAVATLEVSECTDTLRDDGECLAGGVQVHLSWSAVADASYYGIQVEGDQVATTTATSMVIELNDQQTSTIAVIVYDEAGNRSESENVEVEVFANPVVISEVAWGGTAASTEDEWLELYNRTDYVLDLSHVQLRTDTDTSVITLSGTMPAGSSWNKRTYIIERGDGTVTTKTENLAIDFERFSDSGNQLTLEFVTDDFTTEFDTTPEVSACSGWCGGTSTGKFYSMERKDVDTSGSQSTNWQSNDGYDVINEYYDARGYEYGSDRKIYGTVGQENSKGYPEIGYFCAPYTESFEEGGTYSPAVPANLTTANCTYLNLLWGGSGSYAGSVYLGIVGSSTALTGHSISGIKSDQNGDIIDSLENGDNIFVAFWKNYTGASHASDGQAFVDYMTGVGTTTPHSDFRVLNWVYSE